MLSRIQKAFPAFRYKSYRLYFLAQVISLSGSWMQGVAQGWLVFQMTHSPYWVGLISALGLLPLTFGGIFAGAIVDRFPRKTLFVWTQIALLIQALILAVLTITGHISPPIIATMAFLLGILNTLDQPLRNTVVPELVPKEALSSAIALNAGIFNTARATGPALAGIMILHFGSAGAFIFNALTFVAPIIAFSFIRIPNYTPTHHPHPVKFITQGIKYVLSKELIKTAMIQVAITAIFGWSYVAIMPVVAEKVFRQGASGLGLLHSAAGLGAILGAIIVSTTAKKIKREYRILAGCLTFTIAIFFFTLTRNFGLGLTFLFISGIGLILQNATLNSTVQHNVDGYIRGRVMSIYLTMWLGMAPFGNLQVGIISEHFGAPFALRIGAIAMLIFGVWTFIRLKQIRVEEKQARKLLPAPSKHHRPSIA
jgi:MFS family permease